jgi:dihydrofolate reductase
MQEIRVSAIAAISAKNRALGRDNELLWHLPEDLKHFKELTKGHPIIMGRKTYDSILQYLGKPLPNRTSIVLTRGTALMHPDVVSVNSIGKALVYAKELGVKEVFIGGGAAIYELALPHTDRLYLTLVDDEPEADTFFPAYEQDFAEVARTACSTDPAASFVTFDRVQ